MDRIVLYCADVLQFSFGDDHSGGKSRLQQWKDLKGFEELWEFSKPFSFSPIYYQNPDSDQGHCFPRIWYISESHVLAMQYLDLARLLLTVYDPNTPRLGSGSVTATRHISTSVRDIVLRICGNAVSNRGIQPVQVNAHLAIALGAAYFTNEVEQNSMIYLLLDLEAEHGWPTAETVTSLRLDWGLNDGNDASGGKGDAECNSFSDEHGGRSIFLPTERLAAQCVDPSLSQTQDLAMAMGDDPINLLYK